MATNEILQFAGADTGTNLLTQAEYLNDAQRPIGNQPGVARSKLVNKALRQASLISAGVAQFLADNQANNITDSLTPQTIANYMAAVVRSFGIPTAVAGGTADAITADFTPNVALTNGTTVIVRAGAANTTTTPTFAPDGLTAKTIVKGNNLPLAAGDIAGAGHWLEMNFDATLDKWVLQNPAKGVAVANAEAIQGTFKNLQISATGINATVTVTADEVTAEDTAGAFKTLRNVSLSINSAGAGANGLDTGTIAASAWYSVWAIYNPTTLETAGLLSLSATAPTMPSGYTFKARLGWMRTDGTGNKYPLRFKQAGRKAQYVVGVGTNVTALPAIAAGSLGTFSTLSPTWAAVGISNFVPPTASRIMVLLTATSTTGNSGMLAPNNSYSGTQSSNPPPLTTANMGNTISMPSFGEIGLESSSIYAAMGANSVIYCYGWEDNL